MFNLEEKDLDLLVRRVEMLEPMYSGEDTVEFNCDCGDCEARNSSLYCGNRAT